LRVKSWFDDDLPNILGINPIEAAILFGALYYFYGPTTLYEYAREAGRLFSTYAPVVRDISLDIFYEFREYLEEDREREQLRKSGVDIEKMPRRTTNLIERFQDSLSTFSELTDGKKEASELQRAYRNDDGPTSSAAAAVATGAATAAAAVGMVSETGSRKTKREVLLERNVDIDKVMEATEGSSSTAEDALIKESISAVRQRFSQNTNSDNNEISSAAEESSSISNNDEQESASTAPSPSPSPVSKLGLSKFQQQMSGEWNQRVLRKEKYSPPAVGTLNDGVPSPMLGQAGQGDFDDPGSMPFDNSEDDDLSEMNREEARLLGMDMSSVDLVDSFSNDWQRKRQLSVQQSQNNNYAASFPLPSDEWGEVSGNIPQDIASDDVYTFPPLPVAPSQQQEQPQQQQIAAVEVLRELDKDYLALRQRLVDLLQITQQQQQQQQQLSALVDSNGNSSPVSSPASSSTSVMKAKQTKYWPPLARFRYE